MVVKATKRNLPVKLPAESGETAVSEAPRNNPSTVPAAAPVKNNDASAEELSIDLLRERRYLWTARAFSIVSAVALCVNFVLLIAISHLTPLNRVDPFLLTFQNKEDQVVHIRPAKKDLSADDYISEAMIRQYILLRLTMMSDLDEMEFRWGENGPLRWMSSDAVYKAFAKQKNKAMLQIKSEGMTREVRILSVVRNQGIWLVYLNTKDMLPESDEPAEQKWRVQLKIRFFAKGKTKVPYRDRLQNPLGFSVVEYGMESVKS